MHQSANRSVCYVFHYHRSCAHYVQSMTPSIRGPSLERMAVRYGQAKMILFDPSVIAHFLFLVVSQQCDGIQPFLSEMVMRIHTTSSLEKKFSI